MEMGDFFVGGYYGGGATGDFSPDKRMSMVEEKLGENFIVDDLLDFSNEDAVIGDGLLFDNVVGNSTDLSTVTCNSSVSGGENHFSSANFTHSSQFSGEIGVPYDELAELEWLSNFVEDSFSTVPNLQSNHQIFALPTAESSSSSTRSDSLPRSSTDPIFQHGAPLPGKARSKRSMAAPCDWSTRVLHLNPKPTGHKNRDNPNGISEYSGRKCLHCASDKTPQWRTGPMGPKTLCNACGVRYKSGRLVPEYRPAASPTFVSTEHSNSHRKVLEIRRQKDMQRGGQGTRFLSQTSVFPISNGGDVVDDFLIHHHGGPRF
ncbi:GATA transcription factor 4-like [Gossypium australe]|uniref:GATA transcription factor n=1 Tax=Gossypium australe TaxID=47621 RepID=A0A5B6WB63_9ROSI|nr:GATA transcription factor 4-like [Gossypium australe]